MVTNRSRAFSDETLGKMNIKRIIRYRFSRYDNMAQWLSWLERRPVTAEVDGSSPFWVVSYGILAQLGEHLPYKQRVTGSSPVGPIDMPMWLNWQSS